MTAFELETKALRWDLTSVLVTSAYPEQEQAADYAQVRYGHSSGEQKQIGYRQVTTDDGAVPIWDAPYDGNTTDVATVIATMHALREHARCRDFVLLRDSKLLSTPNRRALLRAGSATWPRWPAHPSWTRRCWPSPPRSCRRWPTAVSGNGASRPRSGRATAAPAAHGGEQVHAPRRLFVLSSEKRAA